MLQLRAILLLLSTTCLTLSLARRPTRFAFCNVCQKLRCKQTIRESQEEHPFRDALCSMCQARCKPTIGEGSGQDNEGMRHGGRADGGEPVSDYQEPVPMGSSSDEDQQSPWSEDQDNQDKEDNQPTASGKHNHARQNKRPGGEGKEWNLFPLRNTTGPWLFGK